VTLGWETGSIGYGKLADEFLDAADRLVIELEPRHEAVRASSPVPAHSPNCPP
jgi:hypothetical protein